MRTYAALALTLLALIVPAFAAEPETFTAKVVGVSDGDTLTVLDQAKVQTKIRLHGIDAPEAKQDFGTRAKEALSAMCSTERFCSLNATWIVMGGSWPTSTFGSGSSTASS